MKRDVRGAVIYETAIVMPLVLLLLISTIRAGILGYDQLQSDAAAMTYARYSALNIANPANQTKSLFPATASTYTYATPAVSSAPQASPAIDWSQNIGGETNMNSLNRHGGQSVIVPASLQTLVTAPQIKVFFGIFQKKVSVTGSDIEPLFLECGGHWMVGQSTGSGSGTGTGADCSTAQNPSYYESYFQNGENTPPYYLSQRYFNVCVSGASATNLIANLPNTPNLRPDDDWLNNSATTATMAAAALPGEPRGWNSCGYFDDSTPDGGYSTDWPLGGASYLNVHNWYRPVAGWGGQSSYGADGATWDPAQLAALSTFREMACHQRVYQYIAQSLSQHYYDYVAATNSPTDPNAVRYSDWALNGNAAGTTSFYQVLHTWDSPSVTPGGALDPVDTAASYADGYPQQPMRNCGLTITFPDGGSLTP